MKTVFDDSTREELISRIDALDSHKNTAQWGTMNLYQMLKHCTLWKEWITRKEPNKMVLVGRLFGKSALKSVLKDESPLRRSTPTLKELRIIETTGNIAAEKAKWIRLLQNNGKFSNPDFIHPFFGKMTREQIGYMAYKHADHHLRQFNG